MKLTHRGAAPNLGQRHQSVRFSENSAPTTENVQINFYTPIVLYVYAKLQIVIQFSLTITTLCHIKRDHLSVG